MTEKWETTEEESNIKLDKRTLERLQGTRRISGNKGWQALDPMSIESGELLRTINEV